MNNMRCLCGADLKDENNYCLECGMSRDRIDTGWDEWEENQIQGIAKEIRRNINVTMKNNQVIKLVSNSWAYPNSAYTFNNEKTQELP
jgi:hypothetical protein